MKTFQYTQIGVVRSCFTEKFGAPRQSGLVFDAPGVVELFPPFDDAEAFRGIEGFSHIWLFWHFHAIRTDGSWQATVRPPRLGGNRRIGVFASRSPYRPNPVGLSAVRLIRVSKEGGGLKLHVQGLDLIDGTPILDIKPYLPYTDAIQASGGYASEAPSMRPVSFAPEIAGRLEVLRQNGYPGLKELIANILGLDPRPAYKTDKREYGMRLYDLDVLWRVDEDEFIVTDIRLPIHLQSVGNHL
jgi:tRNA (adenine37-N6)-methyltransferase